MQERPNKNIKKPYKKPAVIFSKKIEVISAVCNSARGGQSGCKKVTPCTRLLS